MITTEASSDKLNGLEWAVLGYYPWLGLAVVLGLRRT
jgi:hypothetical protein